MTRWLTAVDDGALRDVGNENNYKDVPIRLPEGRHDFRERFIDKGTVPLARWLACRAYARDVPESGVTETF